MLLLIKPKKSSNVCIGQIMHMLIYSLIRTISYYMFKHPYVFTFCHSNVNDVVAGHVLGMWCYSHYSLGDVFEGTFCSWGHLVFDF